MRMTLVQVYPWRLEASPQVLTPVEIESITEATQLLMACQRLAQQVRSDASTLYREAHEAGYRAGLDEGRATQFKESLALAESAATYVKQFDRELVSLVSQAILTLLPTLPAQDVLPALIKGALAKARLGRFLILRVNPMYLKLVESLLEDIHRSHPHLEWLRVVADSQMEALECEAKSKYGTIRVNLQTALQILSRSTEAGLMSGVSAEKDVPAARQRHTATSAT
jgi:flagellar biosynthesis/type III secretory pathway protein FliH